MKIIWNSFWAAITMYSRLPAAKTDWKAENRKYALCFFPVIGVVLGLCLYIWFAISNQFGVQRVLYAIVAALLPVFITGGIHIDGFMDVCDARTCLGDRDKQLQVMKDPNVGAFAVIWMMAYILLQTGCFYQSDTESAVVILAAGYVMSRAFSGLAAVTMKNARGEGSLMAFSEPANKWVTVCVEMVWILASAGVMIGVNTGMGICTVMAAVVVYVYYGITSYRRFGGITGDLEGYFVEIVELWMLVVVTAWCVIRGMQG